MDTPESGKVPMTATEVKAHQHPGGLSEAGRAHLQANEDEAAARRSEQLATMASCDHDFHPMTHNGEFVTGQRCRKCGYAEWF